MKGSFDIVWKEAEDKLVRWLIQFIDGFQKSAHVLSAESLTGVALQKPDPFHFVPVQLFSPIESVRKDGEFITTLISTSASQFKKSKGQESRILPEVGLRTRKLGTSYIEN